MNSSVSETVAALQQRGMICQQQGRLDEADAAYRRILHLSPRNASALTLLGVVALQRGDPAAAVDLFGKAIESDPGNAVVYVNLGSAYALLNQHESAIDCYDKAIAIDPESNATPFYNRGTSQLHLRQLEAAIASFDQAIALESDLDANAYFGRGTAFLEAKQYRRAIEDLARSLELGGSYVAEAHRARGVAFTALQAWAPAADSYERAIAARGDDALAHAKRGQALTELDEPEAALKNLDRALQLVPDLAEAYFYRGNALSRLRRLEEALENYDRAIALEPTLAEPYCNRGTVLEAMSHAAPERTEAALADYERAIGLNGNYVEAHSNRGNALTRLHRLNDALESHERAISLAPDHAGCHQNRAITLLLGGDWEAGWQEYEWRLRRRNLPKAWPRREYPQPRWSGRESLTDKTLLLYAEQGLGDTVQFCRYATVVARFLGARVVLEVPPALQSLLTTLDGVSEVVASGEELPAFDFHLSLMSVPLALKTTVSTIPRDVPYLTSAPQKRRFWADKLGPSRRKRVGLVWSGGFRPDQPEAWSVNARRNIALDLLAPLREVDVEFFSLQKGQSAEAELNRLVAGNWGGPPIVDWSALLRDFSDTAALIDQLDLVISVDTSTAHLAGALGKPVWILNRFDTCWRWLLDRSDSPWYPTASIYRQDAPGDWRGVVQRIVHDLVRDCRNG